MTVDVSANRAARKWTRKELLGRLIWEGLRGPLFAWTPRQLWGWRAFVLRMFGARIGRNVQIHPSVRIAVPWNLEVGDYSAVGDRAILYSLGLISIGQSVTVSQNSHLCAGSHDYTRSDMALTKPPISIEDGAWICADAFVGPGTKIGKRAIAAACAVVVKDVPDETVVGGNPATVLKKRRADERSEKAIGT